MGGAQPLAWPLQGHLSPPVEKAMSYQPVGGTQPLRAPPGPLPTGRVASNFRSAILPWAASCLGAAIALAACGGGGGGDPLPAFDSVGGVVVSDLNGDGLVDVAAVVARVDGPPPHAGSAKVWLQRADVPGSFAVSVRYAVGPDPWQLRVADVDGDTAADLVAMSSHASAVDGAALVDVVTVLRGDPAQHGRFLPGATLHAGGGLGDIAVADLDGDGLPDIAFTSYNVGARVGVWWNDPTAPGHFGAPVTVAAATAGELAVADLDADGRPELAYTAGDDAWLVRRDPAAARAFLSPVVAVSGRYLTCLLAVDLDRDSLPDLVLGSRQTQDFGAPGELITQRNDPMHPGRFLAQQRLPLVVHGGECVAVDLDGNGSPDLSTTGAGYGGDLFDDVIVALLADAALPGTLQPAVLTVMEDTSSGFHLAIGDLDHDGRPDAVTPFEGGVLVLRQDPAHPGAFLRWLALP